MILDSCLPDCVKTSVFMVLSYKNVIEYIIMPNHLHGRVNIEDVDDSSNVKTQHAASKDQKNINKAL